MQKEFNSMESQKGQALILVLLVMSVVLAVVLSSVSRSVTEVKTTTYEEDAIRAFSVAEAGVEEKLINPNVDEGPTWKYYDTEQTINYKAVVTKPSPESKQYIYPTPLSSGETATFWLVSHDDKGKLSCNGGLPCWNGGQMSVCYKPESESEEPAVEVSIYYDETKESSTGTNDFAGLTVYRKLFDAGSRGTGGESPDEPCNFGETRFSRKASINTINDIPGCRGGCLILVKVKVLYASDQQVGLWLTSGNSESFPAQNINISSTGTAGVSIRRVDVTRGFPEPPSLFDNAVFSLDGLEK